MNVILENKELNVTVSTRGSEVLSILGKNDDIEYIWTADPAFWNEHAPLMFPICGRLKDGQYTYEGKIYSMGIHGFGRMQEFTVLRSSSSEVVMKMNTEDNEEIRKQYPFGFSFITTHRLEGPRLTTTYEVINEDEKCMYFGIGGHPGFRVPLNEEDTFEDYQLTFEHPQHMEKLILINGLMTDKTEAYPSEAQGVISLKQGKFEESGVFLRNMGTWVRLSSKISKRQILLESSDMKYLGMWQVIREGVDTPYLCLEPWASVPSYYDKAEELTTKRDMIQLSPGQPRSFSYSITIG